MGPGDRLGPLHRWHQPAAGGGGRPARRAAALACLHGVVDDLRPRHRARAALRESLDQVSAAWTCQTGESCKGSNAFVAMVGICLVPIVFRWLPSLQWVHLLVDVRGTPKCAGRNA